MKTAAKPAWEGLTVACLASGPSLTAEDCEVVRASGVPTLVTNTTFRMAPWAAIVYGHDSKWWLHYGAEVARTCTGRRLASLWGARAYGAEPITGCGWYATRYNSGVDIVGIAIAAGAARVVLLGFDCQRTGGKVHWHGDHPATLGNGGSMPKWPAKFQALAKEARRVGCDVLNASRETALTCFPRAGLGLALQATPERMAA